MPAERDTPEPIPNAPDRSPLADEDGWPSGFGRGRSDRRALVVLLTLRGLHPRKLLTLAQREGSAVACLSAIRRGRAGSPADQAFARELDPDGLEERVASCGARVIAVGDTEYPAGLEELADPPAALFMRGLVMPASDRVAIVGARSCTAAGAEIAASLGHGLAGSAVSVVSGAARGIDRAAHEGAIAAGGPTVAVMACGIDRAFRAGGRELAARIAEVGTVVSEYGPGIPPDAFRFPARNRIIAALASAVVVVEGAEGSGSMITADHALDLGRPLFAVPGSVTSPLAHVPLALIRDGATMIRGAADLLEDLGGPVRMPGISAGAEGALALDPEEQRVLAALSGPTLPERVAASAGLTLGQAVATLMRLELRGMVRSLGGRYEARLRV